VTWLFVLLSCRSSHPPPAAAEAPQTLQIGPHLEAMPIPGRSAWRITDTETIPANSLVVQTPGGQVVLADTPFTPRATRDLLTWIETRFGAPPALATISHFHFDASAGIDVLEEAGVPIAVSDRSVALLAERGSSMQDWLGEHVSGAFEGWDVPETAATFVLEEGFRAEIGGTPVEVRFPGAGHAPDNVVTWFPELGVLFGGCMVKGGDDLGNLGDADVSTWPDAMRALEALKPAVVVPGHGDRIDAAMLAHTRAMAEAHRAAAAEQASY